MYETDERMYQIGIQMDEKGDNDDDESISSMDSNWSNTSSGSNSLEALFQKLKNCPKAVDVKLTLFNAACFHHRFNDLVKPFPKAFINEKNEKKLIKPLLLALALMPRIEEAIESIKSKDTSKKQIDLLQWLLFKAASWTLRLVKRNEHLKIIEGVGPQKPGIKLPSWIFEVKVKKTSSASYHWDSQAELYGTKFAFYGRPVQEFYAILNNGLQNNSNSTGSKIALTTNLEDSLKSSPPSYGWANSCFGDRISVVAVCQYIDKAEAKDTKSLKNITLSKKKSVVQNCREMEIRYLMLFSNQHGKLTYQNGQTQSWHYVAWITFISLIILVISLNWKMVPDHLHFWNRFLK